MPVIGRHKVHDVSRKSTSSDDGKGSVQVRANGCCAVVLFMAVVSVSIWAVMLVFYSFVVNAVISAKQSAFTTAVKVEALDANSFLNATLNEAYEAATFAGILVHEYDDLHFVNASTDSAWVTAKILAKTLSYYSSVSSLYAVAPDGSVVGLFHAPGESDHPNFGDFKVFVTRSSNSPQSEVFVGSTNATHAELLAVPASEYVVPEGSLVYSSFFTDHLDTFGQLWSANSSAWVDYADESGSAVVSYATQVRMNCVQDCFDTATNTTNTSVADSYPMKPSIIVAEINHDVLQSRLTTWASNFSAFTGLPVDFEYSINNETIALINEIDAIGDATWTELDALYEANDDQGANVCSRDYESEGVGAAAWNISFGLIDVSRNISAWGAARLFPGGVPNYYGLSVRNTARRVYEGDQEDGEERGPEKDDLDDDSLFSCYDPRVAVKVAISTRAIYAAQQISISGNTIQTISVVLEFLSMCLVLAATAAFSFQSDFSGQEPRRRVSRKWEKVQLFVMQKRRKAVNRRMLIHHLLFFAAIGFYLAGALLMMWWKPTIVRPVVAASFEAHSRVVQFEVADVLHRTEQFSLMTSSAFASDRDMSVTDPSTCLSGSRSAALEEHCLFGGNFAVNSSIHFKLLQFFGSVTHSFVSEIMLVPGDNSFIHLASYRLRRDDVTETQFVKITRTRDYSSCTVALAIPGDGGSGAAAQNFYEDDANEIHEDDDDDDDVLKVFNGTLTVPQSVCAAAYAQSVATQLAGWSGVETLDIDELRTFFPHLWGDPVCELTTSYVSNWNPHLTTTGGTTTAIQQLDSFLVFGGDLSAISDILAGDTNLWQGSVSYISHQQYGGLMVATSTDNVLHDAGYRIEAEDSDSLLITKAATDLHAWHANGNPGFGDDWMLDEWYESAITNESVQGSASRDSSCAPVIDSSGSAILGYAGFVSAVGGSQPPTRVSLLPYLMPSISGRRILPEIGSIGIGVAKGDAGEGTSLEDDLQFCFVTALPIKHQLLIRESAEALLCLGFSATICFGLLSVGRVAFNRGGLGFGGVLSAGSWKTKHGSEAYYQELDDTTDIFRDALGDLSSKDRVARASKYIESLNNSYTDNTKRVARELYFDRTGVRWPLAVYNFYSSSWYSLFAHLCCLLLIALIGAEPPNTELACARPQFYVGVEECDASLIWSAPTMPKWTILISIEVVLNVVLLVDVVLRAVTYGIGSWAPLKDDQGRFLPERRDVTTTRLVLQFFLAVDLVLAIVFGPFEYMRLFRPLRPLLYIWRFEPYRNSLFHFFQTVSGVGSVIALVFIVIFVAATITRAGFEGTMMTSPDTEFQLLELNMDTGFQSFFAMFTLMTTGENIVDLAYGVDEDATTWMRVYLAPFLFFPLCMIGTYLLAGLMIAGFQEEFMRRFMDKVDKRERKFDAVCAYAYALLDTNESGALGSAAFRTFIKAIMAKRTRLDIGECIAGSSEDSLGANSKVTPVDLRAGSKVSGLKKKNSVSDKDKDLSGTQKQAALMWKNKAQLNVSIKESQQKALVDSVFDVITFDPADADAARAQSLKRNVARRMSMEPTAQSAEKGTVSLQKFIHIVKKWNSFRQHYTVKELAVALQFFVSAETEKKVTAKNIANRLWYGKHIYGPIGRVRLAIQSLLINPLFTWAVTTVSILYVPLLGFTVSISEDAQDLDSNTTYDDIPVLTWGAAVHWTEYVVWIFLVLYAVEFSLKLFAMTPFRFWNHYDLGLRYINRVDLTIFLTCTFAYVVSLCLLNVRREIFQIRFIWLSVISLRPTFLLEKVRKSVVMMGIAMPHFASILMVHVALLMLFSLFCMEMLGGKFSPIFNTEPQCHFDSLGASMKTFFTLMIGEGWQYVMLKGIDGGLQLEIMSIFFLLYTMISTLIIVNLMMGIVVDLVVSLQAASEKELWFDSAKALTDKCVHHCCWDSHMIPMFL